tara:strand:+ start:277 stop:477 length:201 start_codon:yes stop_codon:yes gene_type:complete
MAIFLIKIVRLCERLATPGTLKIYCAEVFNCYSGLKYTLCGPAVKCPDAFVLVLHQGINHCVFGPF